MEDENLFDSDSPIEGVVCLKCNKPDMLVIIPRPDTKHGGGEVRCNRCRAHVRWASKEENRNKRVASSLNLAKKYKIHFCELCLRDETELGDNRIIEGHHIIEHGDEGSTDDRENTFGVCTQCHRLIGWARTYYGHRNLTKYAKSKLQEYLKMRRAR